MGADGSPGNLVRQELSQDVKEVLSCRQEVKTTRELGGWRGVRASGLRFSRGAVPGGSGARVAGPKWPPGERVPTVMNAFVLNLFATNMFVTVKW